MKKLLSVILTLTLILSALPLGLFSITASAATSGTTGDCTWTLDGTVLTISGNGNMANYYQASTLPWGSNITKVIINDGVTSIGNYAFSWCYSLTSVTIGNSVTSIGHNAFSGCSRLTTITIPYGVKSIESYAFSYCSSLTSVIVPNSVTNIEIYAFHYCDKLEYNTFGNGKYLGNETNKYFALIETVSDSITEFTFADGVEILASSSFDSCDALTSITIPNTVKHIGSSAFDSCDALTSITIPNSVISIGSYAFRYTGLTDVVIPDSVTNIGEHTFFDCKNLTTVTLGNGVASIGESTFSGCENLTTLTIGNGITSIGYQAFSGCGKLKYNTFDNGNYLGNETNKYVALIETVEYITEFTFADGVKVIAARAFYYNNALTSIIIPDSVIDIGENAFHNCTSLTTVVIPESVSNIESGAFYGCNDLVSIVIPNRVVSVEALTFAGCNELTMVTIGNGVINIAENAFSNCSALKDVYYLGDSADKSKILIDSTNSFLIDATWHYNSCVMSIDHTYDYDYVDECSVCGKLRYFDKGSALYIDDADFCIGKEIEVVARFSTKESDPMYGLEGYITYDPSILEFVSGKNCALLTNGKIKVVLQSARETNLIEAITFKAIAEGNSNVALEQLVYVDKNDTEQSLSGASESVSITSHLFDNACDTECNKQCGYVRTITHSYTLNDAHTCDICKYSKAPAIPTVENKTDISVILVRTEGFEYSKDGTTWQKSNVFEGLSPNTTYTFYQRVAETDTAYASAYSPVLLVTTKQISHIEIESSITKTIYIKGEGLDLSGGIKIYFTDNTYQIEDITLDMVSGFDKNKLGKQTLTVTYNGMTVYYDVSVIEHVSKFNAIVDTSTPIGQTIPRDVTATLELTPSTAAVFNRLFMGFSWLVSSDGEIFEFCQEGDVFEAGKYYALINNRGVFQGIDGDTLRYFNGKPLEYMEIVIGMDGVFSSTEAVFCSEKLVSYTPGDLTGDDKINSLDGLMLMRYLNGWNNLNIASPEAMDVNADGKVNSLDGLLLMRYLNGWNVQLG